jgi:hypothetical protein
MGILAGLLGCVFGVLGILTSGIIFVPLAVLCALVGLARGIVGGNAAGIGTSLLAGILSAIGFAVSPSLWLLTAGLIGASQSDQSSTPKTLAPDESVPSPPTNREGTRPPLTNDTKSKCTLLSGALCPGATDTSPPHTEKAKPESQGHPSSPPPGPSETPIAQSDASLSLQCTPQSADTKDPIVSVLVSVHGLDWQVVHIAASGTRFERNVQYRIHGVPNSYPTWVGFNIKRQNLKMIGRLFGGSNGPFTYVETIYDANRDGAQSFQMRSICATNIGSGGHRTNGKR